MTDFNDTQRGHDYRYVRTLSQHHIQSLQQCIIPRTPSDTNGYWLTQTEAFDVGRRYRITPNLLTQKYTVDYFGFALNLIDFQHRFIDDHEKYAFMIRMGMHRANMIRTVSSDIARLPMLTPASAHMAIVARFYMCACYLVALRQRPHTPRVMGPNDPMLMHPLDPMLIVCMGTHPRLGRDSPLFTLDSNIVERHILPHLYADEQYVTALFARGIPGLFRPHVNANLSSTRRRITPSPPFRSDVSKPVDLHVVFRNAEDNTVMCINDHNVTQELFANIPDASVALYAPQDEEAYLFLFQRIRIGDNGAIYVPPQPERNTKIIDCLHWPNGNTEDEIQLNDLLDNLEHNLVIDTQLPMQATIFTFFNWENLRYQLGLSPFSRRDLEAFRDDARPRVVQVRD